MNKEQKEAWLKEAEMQMKAIRTLEKYNMAALAVAGLGAAFCYFNFRAADRNLLLIICSVALAALGALSSMVLSVGIRNGKANVAKILDAVEGKIPEMPAADKAGASKPGAASEVPSNTEPKAADTGSATPAGDAADGKKPEIKPEIPKN